MDDVSPALVTLLDRFGELLRRAGRHRGLAEHDLDELLQDVRIRLWRALQTGEKISTVTASYVYRTAQTAAVDLIRRRRVSRESPLALHEEAAAAAVVLDAPQLAAVTRDEVTASLESALAGLVRARGVAVRMHLAGYPREEIAALMGWSEAKTRNLVYRGLADLRTRLEALGIGPESVT
jgi:RNA polymerase sigma-70 factor (ECF subfamily)